MYVCIYVCAYALFVVDSMYVCFQAFLFQTPRDLGYLSLLQRFSQFRGSLIHYNIAPGQGMVSLLQRFP